MNLLSNIAQPLGPEVDEINPAEQLRGRPVEQDLAAVACRHQSGRAVQHWAGIIAIVQLSLSGCDADAHRQFQRPLCGDRGVDGGARRGEYGAHPVAGVLEDVARVRLDRLAQHLVVRVQRHPHPLRVGFPTPSGTFDIGEQKRDDARRCGHVHRYTSDPRFAGDVIVCPGTGSDLGFLTS